MQVQCENGYFSVGIVLLGVRIVVLSVSLVSHNFIQNLPLNELLLPWCENS